MKVCVCMCVRRFGKSCQSVNCTQPTDVYQPVMLRYQSTPHEREIGSAGSRRSARCCLGKFVFCHPFLQVVMMQWFDDSKVERESMDHAWVANVCVCGSFSSKRKKNLNVLSKFPALLFWSSCCRGTKTKKKLATSRGGPKYIYYLNQVLFWVTILAQSIHTQKGSIFFFLLCIYFYLNTQGAWPHARHRCCATVIWRSHSWD